MIRPFNTEDYAAVCDLLIRNNVEPPAEASDLGLCLIAEENEEIIGCISAQFGNSTKAYCDFYTASKTMTAWSLLQHMMTVLRLHGIKRVDFLVEQYNKSFLDMALKYGCRRLNPLHWMRCEL